MQADGQTSLVWFGLDLRLADHPALARACTESSAVIPVYIWAPDEESPWAPGAASRWWLHQSLERLQETLAHRGSRLIIQRGATAETLLALAAKTGAKAVYWNRRYEPATIARDQELERTLTARRIAARVCPGNVLFEPGTILNASVKPFQVLTAFWRACLAASEPAAPLQVPRKLLAPDDWPTSLSVADLELEPQIDWAGGIRKAWTPGEHAAGRQLKAFVDGAMGEYATGRDRPDRVGTSRLSPHLHFGELSPRQVWHAARGVPGNETYLREIGWREFSHHMLFHFPRTPEEPLRPEFRKFPWKVDAKGLKAWTRGKTGYPLVDAGMRELWHTGWMHNRIRMVVASFLVKHLMLPWQEGAAWFWDTLVDADLANNTMGWQWTAGCGADAAPYFRIFNPVMQGEKFDPDGEYVRRWVPELASIPSKWIHKPWEAPGLVLAEAGVILGQDYPLPIVDHKFARERALAALASRTSTSQAP